MTTNWQSAFSRVRAALMRRGRSAHDADDVVQEAWVRLACYESEQTVAKPAYLRNARWNYARRGAAAKVWQLDRLHPQLSAEGEHQMTHEHAVLAVGCFRGMQELIRRYDVVISAQVGYSGGDVSNATYRNHGTHAEAIEIVVDPEKMSEQKVEKQCTNRNSRM